MANLAAGAFSVIVTDTANRCFLTDTFFITQPDSIGILPVVTNETCRQSNGSIRLAVTGGVQPYSYLWSSNATDSAIAGLGSGAYTITVTDKNSCRETATIEVANEKCNKIIIHNVITPNGDGINDAWVIEGILDYPDNHVMVFDKWGNLVFEKSDYQNNWQGDGRDGMPVPDGAYYYLLRINAPGISEIENYPTGYLMIKR